MTTQRDELIKELIPMMKLADHWNNQNEGLLEDTADFILARERQLEAQRCVDKQDLAICKVAIERLEAEHRAVLERIKEALMIDYKENEMLMMTVGGQKILAGLSIITAELNRIGGKDANK